MVLEKHLDHVINCFRNLFINKFCKKNSAEAFKATEKVAIDFVLGGGIAGYSGFLHQIQLGSHDLAAI